MNTVLFANQVATRVPGSMIEVQSLSRRYGNTLAVDDVSFQIGNHEIGALKTYRLFLVHSHSVGSPLIEQHCTPTLAP